MKLRNKKTGEIWDIGKVLVNDYPCWETLTQICEDWEDVKEPLIKDEKVRKAVRAWLSIQKQPITAISMLCFEDNDGFFCYKLYGYIEKARIVDGKAVVNNNLTAIYFEFRSDEKIECERNKDYTIAELCGEEEE